MEAHARGAGERETGQQKWIKRINTELRKGWLSVVQSKGESSLTNGSNQEDGEERSGEKKGGNIPLSVRTYRPKRDIFRESTMDGAPRTSVWNDIVASGHLAPDSTCYPDSAPWNQGVLHRRLQHHQHEICEQKAALGEELNRWGRKDRMERRKDIPRHSPVQPQPPASAPRTLESGTQRK